MAKVFEIKKFGGINRDTSTIDRNSASADVVDWLSEMAML